MDFSLFNVLVLLWCVLFSFSGAIHVCFYCFIIFRTKLDSTLHWLLCNVAMNEVMRAVVALCFAKIYGDSAAGIAGDITHLFHGPVRQNLTHPRRISRSQWKLISANQLELKEIPDSLLIILVASIYTTFLFEILALLQRYFSMGWRDWRRTEVFNQRHALLTIVLWLFSGFFGAAFVILRHEQGGTEVGLKNFWQIYWTAQGILVVMATSFLTPIGIRLVYFRWRRSYPSAADQNSRRGRRRNKQHAHKDLITPEQALGCMDIQYITPTWETDLSIALLSGIGAIVHLIFAGCNFVIGLLQSEEEKSGSGKGVYWTPTSGYPFTGIGTSSGGYSTASVGLFAVLNIYISVSVTVNSLLLVLEDSQFQHEFKKIRKNIAQWRRGNRSAPIDL